MYGRLVVLEAKGMRWKHDTDDGSNVREMKDGTGTRVQHSNTESIASTPENRETSRAEAINNTFDASTITLPGWPSHHTYILRQVFPFATVLFAL